MKKFLLNLGLVAVVVAALAVWVSLPWFAALALAIVLALWLVATRRGRQALSVTAVGIGSMRRRLGSSSVIIIGIAGVVGVLVAMLSMGAGFQKTLASGGSADTAIVLRGGSQGEAQSVLMHDDVLAIEQAPGIARDADGSRWPRRNWWSRPSSSRRDRARMPTCVCAVSGPWHGSCGLI
jgi:putative ABC transport system permease protein